MGGAVEIRLAAPEDAGVLRGLFLDLHDASPWPAERDPEATAQITQIRADPLRALSIAEVGGVPVGTIDIKVVINLTRDLQPWAIIENLVVLASARRQGVGRALVEGAVAFAERHGCYKVQLISADKRDAAHELYRATGFVAPVSGYRRYLHTVD